MVWKFLRQVQIISSWVHSWVKLILKDMEIWATLIRERKTQSSYAET